MRKDLGMSVNDAAEAIGVSRPTMYQLIERTDFPKIRVGRRIIIPRRSFEEWLEKEAKGENME